MPADLFSPRADEVSRVLLSRSRFLAVVGGALFATVLQVTAPKLAAASDSPYPCFAYHPCQCCSGQNCCTSSGCYGGFYGCPTGSQCWFTCDCVSLYQCCDWAQGSPSGPRCVCSGYIGSCTQC